MIQPFRVDESYRAHPGQQEPPAFASRSLKLWRTGKLELQSGRYSNIAIGIADAGVDV